MRTSRTQNTPSWSIFRTKMEIAKSRAEPFSCDNIIVDERYEEIGQTRGLDIMVQRDTIP